MPSLALSRLRTRLCDQGPQLLDGSLLTVTSPLTHSQRAVTHSCSARTRGESLGPGMKSGHKWIKLLSGRAEIALWFHITSAASVWRVAQTIVFFFANGAAFKAVASAIFKKKISMVRLEKYSYFIKHLRSMSLVAL